MAVPSTTMNKAIALASDGVRRSKFPDGSDPNASAGDLPQGDIFFTGFEDGTMAGNADFTWHALRATSIVTMDPGPTVIYNPNGVVYEPSPDQTKDWTALSGNNSLRFRFAAGTDPNAFAEQRFSLVGRAERTLWMRFSLRVPTNFVHSSTYNGGSSDNNKLFAIWCDDYSSAGDGSTIFMSFRPNGSDGSNFYVQVSAGRFTVGGGDQQYMPFISVPADRGRWMHICCKIVMESVEDASDGTVETWRRWANEESWTKTHDLSGQPLRIPASGPQGLAAGYLMGADNSGYAAETEFLMDDFTLSTTSLL